MNLLFILYENITILLSIQACIFFLYLYKYTKTRQNRDIYDDVNNMIKDKQSITIKYEDKYKNKYVDLNFIQLTIPEKEQLKNNFIMENTPLGNVIMYYSYEKNGFVYYSDSTIPYRFLETVGRKYVTTFKCKDYSVYTDENDVIPEIKTEAKTDVNCDVNDNSEDKECTKPSTSTINKNVFAKFKNYNHPSSIPSTSMITKINQMSNKNTGQSLKEVKNVKEIKNKYISEGKICNFSFIKKIDKKQIVKRLNMTFAEFKKMQQELKK
jgi:hypothetical protein